MRKWDMEHDDNNLEKEEAAWHQNQMSEKDWKVK